MSPTRPPRPPALRYRPARRTDVEALAELGLLAYRVSSVEKRREFYTDHPRFGPRDVRVGELDGRIVASLVLYPLVAFVRGQRVPVTGVGSVAVSPEHRRRGIGEALMRAALREMRQRGNAFSALYAWRGSYYRKLGWGAIEIVHQIAISPTNLPHSEHARRVRRLMLPDRSHVEALYERVAQQSGHFALARRPEWWSRRLWTYPGDWVVYEGRRRGQIEGYLHYDVDTENGPFKLSLTLDELVAATPEAHAGLTGYLATLADQTSEIHALVPGDHAWTLLLGTAQDLRPGAELSPFTQTGRLGHGAMLRITDAKAALEVLPVAAGARGELVIEIEDGVLPANARAWRVSARDGRLKAKPETGRAGKLPRLPRVTVPIEMLGPLLAGTIAPTRAAEVGLIGSSDGADVMDGWFRGRAPYLYPMNAF